MTLQQVIHKGKRFYIIPCGATPKTSAQLMFGVVPENDVVTFKAFIEGLGNTTPANKLRATNDQVPSGLIADGS